MTRSRWPASTLRDRIICFLIILSTKKTNNMHSLCLKTPLIITNIKDLFSDKFNNKTAILPRNFKAILSMNMSILSTMPFRPLFQVWGDTLEKRLFQLYQITKSQNKTKIINFLWIIENSYQIKNRLLSWDKSRNLRQKSSQIVTQNSLWINSSVGTNRQSSYFRRLKDL